MNVVLLSIILGLISESDAGEKIPIKLDFDISKFVGQWYFVGIGMKPGDDISDIINPVYVTPENCHLQVKFLIFKDGECVSYKFEARRTLIGGNFRLSGRTPEVSKRGLEMYQRLVDLAGLENHSLIQFRNKSPCITQ
ncbi:uncharacterized protein LOC119946626 isoform X3 [Tachyglossus aculeatus]|uniref:uncharacterized protein LOC119946626 isoform X3 n=1 Tax=Tachyglossus aculeatus TaxID=9261 RepID=UPI0018F759D2|nr:uncharacterized protein LOC119946626 isoform X3 [Tachyglossus aculeatus]